MIFCQCVDLTLQHKKLHQATHLNKNCCSLLYDSHLSHLKRLIGSSARNYELFFLFGLSLVLNKYHQVLMTQAWYRCAYIKKCVYT